ncbi:MAG TPA: chromosome segregation protein SMC [Dehalococcoidia bacterium]
MYLKRLDVQGFKSFANKTALEFSPGVTCVVGPNGTGKTNVADSLRWVLGEHASRNLRARKTEDVIFAGSDKRAPLGAAEVNITLDNSGHWLPIDYDEVVVTRRAYRNGENEYLINNAKVRLRDVVELFQRAQVGQNSYAFMGQGMVEQVLSLRPEDRRAIIEEAADVRVYRHKLEDAQSKLKATRENLDRVRMLVREIEPRITQLERQAGRAVRYQELTQELAALLHAWFSHQWRDVNEQVLAALTSQDQVSEDFERARAEVKACEDGLAQLRAAIDERRGEIYVREGRATTLQDYARDLDRRVGLDEERQRMLAARIDELAAEIASLREEQSAQPEITLAPDVADRERQLESARTDLEAQRSRLANVEQEIVALQRSALTNEQTAARARALVDDLARRIGDAADAVARLHRDDAAAAEARRIALSELAAWARAHAALLAEASSVIPQVDPSLAERLRTMQSVSDARATSATLDEEIRSLRAEAESVRIRIELLEQNDVRPQAPDAGVRAILEAGGIIKRETVAPDAELTGVLGYAGNGRIVRVPPGLEKAIEAALGENLFAIVVERDADMRAAINFLVQTDAGHATVYALDSFHEQRPIHLIKERGVIGVASGLVRCDGRYRRLVDTLLGRTVIVEDLALAHRFVKRGLAQAVATLDGILLRPVGSMAAGPMMTVQATFAHERQIEDLPEQLARLDPMIAQRDAELVAQREIVATGERRVAELDDRIESLRASKSRLDAAVSQSRGVLATLSARFHSIGESQRRRGDEAAALLASQTRMDAERDTHTHEALAAEEREQNDRRAIADLDAGRRQLADAVAELAATVAHLEGSLRTDRQATQGEIVARERLGRQIDSKEEQRAKSQDEAKTIASRIDSTRRELNEKTAEIDGLRVELEPARRELAQFESRERTMSTELAEANAHLRETERARGDAENLVRVRREELEMLRQSLEAEGFVATADGEVERLPQPEPERNPEADDDPEAAANGDLPGWLRTDDGDAIPPIRGGSTINPTELRDRIADLRAQIRNLGPVNEQAASDYADNRQRFDYLTSQLADMQQAEAQLLEACDELETVIRERFRTTFKVVNREFERYFNAFFRGGTASLELGETDDDGLPGIEIYAQPPGKKLGSLALLSGGERSLTAVALLFALLQANPSPICVLDEVDAALDEANVGRFVEELRALAERTQFIIITHNRRTIENADTIYGVSMGADNVSRVLSLKLADVTHAE